MIFFFTSLIKCQKIVKDLNWSELKIKVKNAKNLVYNETREEQKILTLEKLQRSFQCDKHHVVPLRARPYSCDEGSVVH